MFHFIVFGLGIFYGSAFFISTRLFKNKLNMRMGFAIAASVFSCIAASLYIISLFYVIYFLDQPEYYKEIDDVSQHYTIFSGAHVLSLAAFCALSAAAAALLLFRGRRLPPLAMSLCIAFAAIGAAICAAAIIQFSCNTDKGAVALFSLSLAANIIVSLAAIIKAIIHERDAAAGRHYENKILNALNGIIGKRYFIFAFILLIPAFAAITAILALFGQEPDSMIKGWTETSTWAFSQKEHPPYLDHRGHYLCTAAACGHPRVVKPLRLGTRRGKTIIVNRQLQIANAYEELIEKNFPMLHRIIRSAYDRCGFPISKMIAGAYMSDIVYIAMKPLEYFFLANLYMFAEKPEKLIAKQYA